MSSYAQDGYFASGYEFTSTVNSSPAPTYPFDYSGILSSNKILNEPQSVNLTNGVNAFLIIPDASPFFGDSLTIVNSTGNTLVEGIDYYLSHPWKQASDQTGSRVFGSITFLSGYMVGNYKLNYQTLGGYYVDNPLITIQRGLIAANDTYVTLDLSSVPQSLPPTPHTHDLNSQSGMTEVYQALYSIANVLKSPKSGVHFNDVIGMLDMYAIGTVDPLLQMVGAIAATRKDLNNVKQLLLPIYLENDGLLGVDKTLNSYEIPLFGPFKLKIGKLNFTNSNIPNKLYLPGNPYTNCLFSYAVIHNLNSSDAIPTTDSIIVGGYDGVDNSISVLITLDTINNVSYTITELGDTTNEQWWAIGVPQTTIPTPGVSFIYNGNSDFTFGTGTVSKALVQPPTINKTIQYITFGI